MALRLDRFVPTDVALVLVNILPGRFQLLKRLCWFMALSRIYYLIDSAKVELHITNVLLREMGKAWSVRVTFH